jgi:hypothetical protein
VSSRRSRLSKEGRGAISVLDDAAEAATDLGKIAQGAQSVSQVASTAEESLKGHLKRDCKSCFVLPLVSY